MKKYIYQYKTYPNFTWKADDILNVLTEIARAQGALLGKMQQFGFSDQNTVMLDALTTEITKSSEIEGELLDSEQVRSSLARRLDIHLEHPVRESHHIDGIVQTLMDATQNYTIPLSKERLCSWHAALFPTGYSGTEKIIVGDYRKGEMEVVSDVIGKRTIYYEAPLPNDVPKQMEEFLFWINTKKEENSIIRAAIAHLWFVIIHPFDDGNGRIARTITEMMLAKAENTSLRFYSMSAQIQREKRGYYKILEQTTTGDTDITTWIVWFCECLLRAIKTAQEPTNTILYKSQYWRKNAEKITNEKQRNIINMLLDGFEGNLTSTKVAKIQKISQDTASRLLQDLTERGFMERIGAGRSTHYILKDISN